jgi:hypothetical protein
MSMQYRVTAQIIGEDMHDAHWWILFQKSLGKLPYLITTTTSPRRTPHLQDTLPPPYHSFAFSSMPFAIPLEM